MRIYDDSLRLHVQFFNYYDNEKKKKKIDRQTDRKKNKHIIDHPYIYMCVCVEINIHKYVYVQTYIHRCYDAVTLRWGRIISCKTVYAAKCIVACRRTRSGKCGPYPPPVAHATGMPTRMRVST